MKKDNQYCIGLSYYKRDEVEQYLISNEYKFRCEGMFIRIFLKDEDTKESLKLSLRDFSKDSKVVPSDLTKLNTRT